MNQFMYDVMLKEKRRELLEEAERQRLVALHHAANTDNAGRLAELQRALGDFLIRLGEKLKTRAGRPIGFGQVLGSEHL